MYVSLHNNNKYYTITLNDFVLSQKYKSEFNYILVNVRKTPLNTK